jgi:hypothetical protein
MLARGPVQAVPGLLPTPVEPDTAQPELPGPTRHNGRPVWPAGARLRHPASHRPAYKMCDNPDPPPNQPTLTLRSWLTRHASTPHCCVVLRRSILLLPFSIVQRPPTSCLLIATSIVHRRRSRSEGPHRRALLPSHHCLLHHHPRTRASSLQSREGVSIRRTHLEEMTTPMHTASMIGDLEEMAMLPLSHMVEDS